MSTVVSPPTKSTAGKSSSKMAQKNTFSLESTVVVGSPRRRLSNDIISMSPPSSIPALSKISPAPSTRSPKKPIVPESSKSPSSPSTTSKSSSLSSTSTLNTKKRLFDAKSVHHKHKKQDRKLAAYEIDWFDSVATHNECLKYDDEENISSSEEEKIFFLLANFDTCDIKLAFADAIGKIGQAARAVFYPLPPRKEKLMNGFVELILGASSLMYDCHEDSFR